jgi:flagellar basal body-associated protein FliL
MDWIKDNLSWIFSGVGIVLFTGAGYVIKRFLGRSESTQSQTADRGSVAIQAGRDVKVSRGSQQKPK